MQFYQSALGNCYGLKLGKWWLQFKKIIYRVCVTDYNFRHTFVPCGEVLTATRRREIEKEREPWRRRIIVGATGRYYWRRRLMAAAWTYSRCRLRTTHFLADRWRRSPSNHSAKQPPAARCPDSFELRSAERRRKIPLFRECCSRCRFQP